MRIVWSLMFVISGLFLFFYPQIEKEISDAKQEELIQAFEQLGDVSTELEASQTTEVQVRQNQSETALLEGSRGIIRIPEIDLEMMIFEGSSEASLSKGTGIIEPEKEFGVNNVGVAGHRGVAHGKYFNRLDELVPNDVIKVETKEGIYEFVVTRSFVVDQTEVGVLKDKQEPIITLVTCTPIGKADTRDRLIVQAKLKQKG